VVQRFYWRAVAQTKDELKSDEDEPLMAWLITQQNCEDPDNRPVAARIIAFHEHRVLPTEERVCRVAISLLETKSNLEASNVTPHPKFLAVISMLVCGLNTLIACNAAGGARALFERLSAAPESAFAKQYVEHAFANDRIQRDRQRTREGQWANRSVVGKALVGSVGKALDARDFCAARPRIVGSAMAAAVALLIGVAELGLLDANSTGVSS